jgi:hypothetical protein
MAGAVGKSTFCTLLFNVRRCKQVKNLFVVSSKLGHRFKSEYKAAVLQELKKPLIIDEQKRKKLQKDEVSILCYISLNVLVNTSQFNLCRRGGEFLPIVLCIWLG